MKVSTKGRYAVMALVDIALNGGAPQASASPASLSSPAALAGRPVSLADVASRQAISLSYLEQLFARLRRSGLVRSVRGPGGGYLLARPLEAIAVGDIVQSVEAGTRPLASAGEGTVTAASLTQALWDGLGSHIRGYLGGITLAQVVGANAAGEPASRYEDKRSAA